MELKDLVASLNLTKLLPESLLIALILVILLVDLIFQKRATNWLSYICLGSLSLTMISLVTQFGDLDTIAFLGSFQGDSLSILFRLFIVFSTFLCVLLSVEYVTRSGTALAEFLVLLVTSALGGMLLVGSNDLIMIFLSLETLGLSSYLLTGYMKRDIRSNEASIKYLLIGALSSSLLLYGFSFLYGVSGGEMQISKIALKIVDTNFSDSLIIWFALLLTLVGIGFKLGIAPFHQWVPDVYEGSPTPVVAFLSVGSKAAGLGLATHVLTLIFPYLYEDWRSFLEIFAILSMILGNTIALTQTSIKRMLGYSSIGQAGFLLMGLTSGSSDGYSSMLVYMFLYIFMNLGAFACVILFGLKTGSDQISDYAGLSLKDPLLCFCLSASLLSLGGIPPLAGFFGKLYLFWSSWQSGFYTLVYVGLITSVISIYYYLRIVKIMIGTPSQEMSITLNNYSQPSSSIKNVQLLDVGLWICVLGSTFAGILLNPLISVTQSIILDAPSLQSNLNFIQRLIN